jgi:TonB family protein
MKYLPLIVSTLAILATPTYAEQTNTKIEPKASSAPKQSIIRANPIKREPPKYPNSARRKGQEGWVRLSYVIEPDGSVSNAFVVDSSGLKSFEHSAIKSITQWQFEPAKENGKPIQQCVNSIQLDYTMPASDKPNVRRRFANKYKKVLKILEQKNHKLAQQLLNEMGQSSRHSLYEDRLYWQLNAFYHQDIGDENKALSHFKRAAYLVHNKPDQLYLNVAENTFRLQLKLRLYSDALTTFYRLKTPPQASEFIERLKPYKQRIVEFINTDSSFSVPLVVGERGFARYALARHAFELHDVKGQIDKIEVFCKNKKNTFDYSENSAWTIPQSWGRCSLYVYGSQQATFNIVEHPKST